MKRSLPLLLCTLGLLFATEVVASESPKVQIQVEPAQVIVGETVTLRVSVYSPTWFPQPPEFPSFELPNTITRLPPNSSGPVSTRIEGSTWSGVQRRYQVTPLIPGRFVIDSQPIGVTYADPESRSPITVQVPLPAVTIEASVPAGAEDIDPYIAGTSFTLERSVEGDLDSLKVGDALVIRYRASIDGLPAVFLPPMAWQGQESGARVYADEPVLSQEGARAVREERITLVFESGGEVTVPGRALRWWNTRTSAVEIARLDDLQLRIEGVASGSQGLSQPASAQNIWWVVGAGLIAALMLWRLLPGWRRWRAWRQADEKRFRDSEAFAFRGLQQALRQGDQRESYRQLLRWLWRLEPGLQSEALAAAVDDAELTRQLQLLRSVSDGSGSQPPDYAGLYRALAAARRQYRARQSGSRDAVLPALNPQ